jgi:hypothetical protein
VLLLMAFCPYTGLLQAYPSRYVWFMMDIAPLASWKRTAPADLDSGIAMRRIPLFTEAVLCP